MRTAKNSAMTTAQDLKSTLNLPKTDFPMKANLPHAEPERLAIWQGEDLYRRVRAARRGLPIFVLHDGPPYANGHIHLGTVVNKVLKDLVVRSQSMAGRDAPYLPGWDCHGLPIELQVDKDLGPRKKEMSPVAFRRQCRAYAEKFVAIQRQEFERLGILGEWNQPYLTMAPSYQATIVRQLADFAAKGEVYKAKKSVHWCISCRTALAEAEVEYDEHHVSPSIDVRFALADSERERLSARHPGLKDKNVFAVIWTTTPWTLPANLALAFHPEADYAFYPVVGTSDVLLLAKAVSQAAQARYWGGEKRLGTPLAETKGAALEHVRFRHPWLDRDAPGVLADYVALDTGTGVVHTAPGHGWDDYLTGVRYGLDIYCPVDEAGRFLHEVEHFAGQKVFEANPKIIDFLRGRGALVWAGQETHSYPICWRCKHPIIFRATEQWFIALDGEGKLREKALAAIEDVKWFPSWGKERIRNMIATRPDWCISRQRLWGVPIPAFYCKSCGEAVLRKDLLERVADLFEKESADAWYEREAKDLLPPGFHCPRCQGEAFDKERDILDVWFDSGSSQAAVLGHRADLPWPADVYLEGSDQHRGWFHSSLLIGVGTRGAPPYRQVITHGFTVDAEGKKISKSLGNDVDSQKLIASHGAEILRLWTIMVDYREDMRFSDDMLKRVSEAYRKIRNTCRYLISNLYDFDPATDAVLDAELDDLDGYALAYHWQFVDRVRAAYDSYSFHIVYHELVGYCAEISSIYFDILKDRLYCDAPNDRRRRSAQTVLHRILDELTRLLAPVLPFTADEVWSHVSGHGADSVHTTLFPAKTPLVPGTPTKTGEVVRMQASDLILRWSQDLFPLREEVLKKLEEARAARTIGSSLEARVHITAPAKQLDALRKYESQSTVFPGNLANLFIVSKVDLEAEGPLAARVGPAPGRKCERCWTYSENVGRLPVHPAVCERCAAVLERR
ncbi:MAG TPA: isoleucine--tRNA ligase [Vicinamibacteria bacterium]|nr:isoleucine--tRNA ligase [Vicinamibacteria bacterium]